jgi:uncharacterized 2Fe-2S/4Fe-4S cluster protein (DUF4445 family)
MSSHIVVFLPDGACVQVESGESILEAASAAGIAVDSACGGQGACGKCRVVVTLGRPGGSRGDTLSKEDLARGMVLACQATVEDDLVVEVPLESQRGELQILMDQTQTEGAGVEDSGPRAERRRPRITPPEEDREKGDVERLVEGLRAEGRDEFCEYGVGLEALRALPVLGREEGWELEALVGDFGGRGEVFGLEACGDKKGYGIAVDVGTTTVVVHLIETTTAGFVDACASLNDQVAHGEDVISRIIWTQEQAGGLGQMREAARGTINRCVRELVQRQGIEADEIIGAACVGNTVMTHLLLGIEPAAIRREPYVPAVRSVPTLRAEEVGLGIHRGAPVYLAPCVSSYVGGDITAGALAVGLGETPRLTLFIDMGTNGEMVIGGEEWLMCCSCSAGPAFEGSGVEYGMYATVGAMERVSYDAGTVDRAGRINLDFESRRVRVRDERPEFVLVWGEEVGRADDISIGEDGIQNLIRSKSAVYAGTTTLLDSLGLDASSVEQVLVAGAFGNYLDAESAVLIGLLPDVPLDRIRFVGNTAVAGARMALLGREARRRMEELAGRMTNFELSVVPGYMDRYVSGLFLPHTDLRLFPSVAEKLEMRA